MTMIHILVLKNGYPSKFFINIHIFADIYIIHDVIDNNYIKLIYKLLSLINIKHV